MSIDLTEREQAVLNAACVRIEKATAEAQALKRAAEEAARKAEIAGHEARGVYRSIMELSGKNPDAHQVNWDGTTASVTELPKPEPPAGIPGKIDPENIVPIRSYPPAPGEDGDAETGS